MEKYTVGTKKDITKLINENNKMKLVSEKISNLEEVSIP